MSNGSVLLKQDPTGDRAIDTEIVEVGGVPVHRQRVVVVDAVTIANPTADPETGLATDATLEQIRDRSDFPLPAAQVSALTPPASVVVSNLPSTQTVAGTVSVGNLPETQPISGTVAVSNLPATQAVSDGGASLTVDGAVSVSNFPATQPISGTVTANAGSGPWPVTDNGGSLTVDGSVAVSNFPATQPVSGTVSLTAGQITTLTPLASVGVSNFPSTQTVAGTVAVSNLPATQPVSGTVSVGNFPGTQPVSGTVGVNNFPVAYDPSPATLCVSVTAAAGAIATATLPAVVGQFHYISRIQIVKYNTAAVTGTATPVVATTTNLPGSLAFTFPRFGAVGAVGTGDYQDIGFDPPMKSSVVNTATTVVGPATTSVLWRVSVWYRAAA